MSEAILNCFCQTTTLYCYDKWRFRMKIFEHRFAMVRNGQLGQKTRLWLCLNLVLNARPKEFLSIIQFILPSKKHSFEISIEICTIMKKWNVLLYHWINRMYNNFITFCSFHVFTRNIWHVWLNVKLLLKIGKFSSIARRE